MMNKTLVIFLLGLLLGASALASESWIVTLSPESTLKDLQSVKGLQEIQRIYPQSINSYWDRTYTVKASQKTIQRLVKKNILQTFEIDQKIEMSSITIENAQNVTSDQYSSYQWYLRNQGQKLTFDLTDILNQQIIGVPGFDLGWTPDTSTNSNKISVAVLDSGVDIDHPELRENILRSATECDSLGRPIPEAKEDHDQNGFAGDCAGWNFVEDNNSVFDKDGHGTHVSGLIAASANNQQGIAGVSGHVQILPLRVLGYDTAAGSNATSGFISKVTKALIYATRKKVKIINMSLGWPLGLDSPSVREALRVATDQGIIIVVAAGNNASYRPVFPCAHDRVICVGSGSADGKKDDFSNEGAHVDFMAPGRQILSLNPTHITPLRWPVKGYEIRTGTSQASPLVAGAVARLVDAFPEATWGEIYSRLALSSKSVTDLATAHGYVQLEKALQVQPQVYLQLNSKNLPLVEIQKENKFQFPIKVMNLWKEAENITIEVLSPSGYQLAQAQFKVSRMKAGEERIFLVDGIVENPSALQESSFEVVIQADGFSSKTKWLLAWSTSKSLKNSKNFVLADKSLNLTSVMDVLKDEKSGLNPLNPVYYNAISTKNETEEWKTQVDFFELQAGLQKSIVELKEIQNILQVYRLQAGPAAYLIVSSGQAVSDSKKFFQYTFLDSKFQCLQNQNPNPIPCHWRWVPRVVSWNPNYLSFQASETALPLSLNFISQGSTPAEDLQVDPWGENPDSIRWHIYQLQMTEIKNDIGYLQERLRDHKGFYEKLRKQFQLQFFDNLQLRTFSQQSKADFLQNRFSVQLALEGSGLMNLLTVQIQGGTESVVSAAQVPVSSQELTLVRSHVLENFGSENWYSYKTSLYQLTLFDSKLNRRMELKQTDLGDPLVTVKNIVQSPAGIWVIVESRYRMLVFNQQGQIEDTFQVHRSTFIPGAVFSDLFYPVLQKKDGLAEFGYLVDSTVLYYRQFGLIRLQLPVAGRSEKAQWVMEARDSLSLSPQCRLLNPSVYMQTPVLVNSCFDGAKTEVVLIQ